MKSTKSTMGGTIIIFFIYLFTMSGKIGVVDAYMSYYTARALVEKQSFDIKTGSMKAHIYLNQVSKGLDGKYYSVFQPGCLPFLIFLIYLSKIVGFFLPSSITSNIRYVDFFVSLYAPIISFFVIYIFYLICIELKYKQKTAQKLSFILAFATPIWVYSKVNFNEPLEILSILFSFYCLIKIKNNNYNFRQIGYLLFISGFSIAYSPFTRIVGVLAVPGIIFYFFYILIKKIERKYLIKSIIIFFLPQLVLMLLLFYYNYFRFGNIFDTGDHYYAKNAYSFIKGVYYNFISPQKGLFIFCPILLLFILYVKDFYKNHKFEAISLLLVFLPFFIYIPSIEGFSGSWAYGPRHFLFLVPILLFIIGYYFEKKKNKIIKLIFIILLTASSYLTFISMSFDPLSVYRFYYEEQNFYKNTFKNKKECKNKIYYLVHYNVLPDGIWYTSNKFFYSNLLDLFMNKSLKIRGISLKKYHYFNFWFVKIYHTLKKK